MILFLNIFTKQTQNTTTLSTLLTFATSVQDMSISTHQPAT